MINCPILCDVKSLASGSKSTERYAEPARVVSLMPVSTSGHLLGQCNFKLRHAANMYLLILLFNANYRPSILHQDAI